MTSTNGCPITRNKGRMYARQNGYSGGVWDGIELARPAHVNVGNRESMLDVYWPQK
jgi:hypothetical protein